MSTNPPEEVQLTDEFDSIEDIAQIVIEACAETQECAIEDLETIPVQAIDEYAMPKAIENDTEISQEAWDTMRDLISAAIVSSGGYHID